MKKKILTSTSSFGSSDPKAIKILKDSGFEVVNNQYGRKLSEAETIEFGSGCIGIVAGVELYNKEVLDQLEELVCISRVGVGIDAIDIEYAETRGIKVFNTPDGPTQSVAELTLGLAINLLRRIHSADSNMKNRIWKKEIGSLLFGRKIGVIGLGRIGKKVSEMFQLFGCEIMGTDLNPDTQWAMERKVQICTLEELLKRSEIVSIHTSKIDHEVLIGKNELDLMDRDSFLINVSRGGNVDESALFEQLHSKKIGGAAVDVFNEEPYNGNLCDLDNVILLPHLGSYAQETKIKMEIEAVNNLINYLTDRDNN